MKCANAVIYLSRHDGRQTRFHSYLYPMLWAASNSFANVRDLSAHGDYRSVYVVARGVVEGCVNILYLMVSGDDVLEQAVQHALQRTYRRQNYEHAIGSSRVQVQRVGKDGEPPQLPQVVLDAIAEFSTKQGREIREWTAAPLTSRMETIGEVLGDRVLQSLHIAYDAVYRDSSEIIHGTLFGALFAMGWTEPRGNWSHDEANAFVNGHLFFVLMAVAAAFRETIAECARDLGNDRLAEICRAVGSQHLEALGRILDTREGNG